LELLRFFAKSNLLISFAAVSLTLASQVQLGQQPQLYYYVAVVFFATLLEYNFHVLVAANGGQEAMLKAKRYWAFGHIGIIKILFFSSLAGLVFSMFFVSRQIIFVFGLLSILTLFYTSNGFVKGKSRYGLQRVIGLKTVVLAFVWAAVTVYLPVLQSGTFYGPAKIILLFVERFAFIFAIAIPFDIRDMETDSRAGVKSFPVVFGSKRALQISNSAMLVSAMFTVCNYYLSGLAFVSLSCLISVLISFFAINSFKTNLLTHYYYGILDGCLVLYGLLVCVASLFY
jgi:4-hydroxybenzoate polyprenyltransferase